MERAATRKSLDETRYSPRTGKSDPPLRCVYISSRCIKESPETRALAVSPGWSRPGGGGVVGGGRFISLATSGKRDASGISGPRRSPFRHWKAFRRRTSPLGESSWSRSAFLRSRVPVPVPSPPPPPFRPSLRHITSSVADVAALPFSLRRSPFASVRFWLPSPRRTPLPPSAPSPTPATLRPPNTHTPPARFYPTPATPTRKKEGAGGRFYSNVRLLFNPPPPRQGTFIGRRRADGG